ncbi:hypothetical protein HNR44_000855 [Geomicrobium halophilum]|uniref:Uncharacterized protein n=1 Tax=Geomicrobium halophilum TaxID=549000 RepID=A0A841PNY5_9BACL|nr:hypothetical protein [Geomicrobium halophilum]
MQNLLADVDLTMGLAGERSVRALTKSILMESQ